MSNYRRALTLFLLLVMSFVAASTTRMTPSAEGASAAAGTSCAVVAAFEPKHRVHPGIAPAGHHGSVYLFGGQTDSDKSLHDMWRWTGSRWTPVSNRHAPVLYDPFMAPDPLHPGLVLIGLASRPSGATPLSLQMWKWDGKDWSQLHPATMPSAGYYTLDMTMAVDNHSHALLMAETVSNAAYAVHNELWSWDGKTWRKLLVDKPGITGNTVPGRIVTGPGGVVYGLAGLAFTLSGLVRWNGSSFTPLQADGLPRTAVAASYDPAHDTIVIVGSNFSWNPDVAVPSDTTYTYDGSRWTHTSFPLQHWVGMYLAGDAPHADVLMWGGRQSQGFINRPVPRPMAYPASWRWTGTAWKRSLAGCAGTKKSHTR